MKSPNNDFKIHIKLHNPPTYIYIHTYIHIYIHTYTCTHTKCPFHAIVGLHSHFGKWVWNGEAVDSLPRTVSSVVRGWLNLKFSPSSTDFLSFLSGNLVGCDWCNSVGHHPTKQKVGRFNSQSGYMPGLWVWSPVGVHTRGN